jgi:hypothetical protein
VPDSHRLLSFGLFSGVGGDSVTRTVDHLEMSTLRRGGGRVIMVRLADPEVLVPKKAGAGAEALWGIDGEAGENAVPDQTRIGWMAEQTARDVESCPAIGFQK